MWFGTADGLNKYDGYEFTVYRHNDSDKNSINNNRIVNIIEDDKGIIWIGIQGGGLNRYDVEKNTFIHFKFDSKNEKSISSDHISAMLQDKEGNLWIGTQNGINLFD